MMEAQPVLLFVLLLGLFCTVGLLVWVFYNVSRRGATDVERLAGLLSESDRSLREETRSAAKDLRQEVAEAIGRHEAAMRGLLDDRLRDVQQETSQKLEQIRGTVDEKLHETLDRRITQSFQSVSERLEQVHRGLGEMQALAIGVGDLKKVLMNVKTRGTWGEVQLGTLLEQMLTPDQYAANVATRSTSERVEFAIKLPGQEPDRPVWLPIDAKFPLEPYQRLMDANDAGDLQAIDQAGRQFEAAVRNNARTIQEKYLDPPATTDFAIMFMPTESLYAEVLRRPGMAEGLQRAYRVTVAGPTNLAAILSSLQLGFRTLAIEKRSSEVWQVLGEAKAEFGKYAVTLERIKKKLAEAVSAVDDAEVRTRAINRKLRDVEELPQQLTLDAPAPAPPTARPLVRSTAASANAKLEF
jgi:DNA recombination protein RmuC